MVYVDNARTPLGRMKMCHMVADTTEELLAMADRIGVARKWLKNPGEYKEHFDVALAKRDRAISAGVEEIDGRRLANILAGKRGAT